MIYVYAVNIVYIKERWGQEKYSMSPGKTPDLLLFSYGKYPLRSITKVKILLFMQMCRYIYVYISVC